jgi:hypothetical protein
MGLIESIMFESETPMGLRRLLTAQAQPWGSGSPACMQDELHTGLHGRRRLQGGDAA